MFLSLEEMKTHLYRENVEIISRGDGAIMQAAIDAAQAEARGYLGAYDTDTVFSREGSARNALLLIFIKDMATWHFLVLCNAGHELSLRQDRYDRAVSWLKAVQRGDVTPDLPAKADDGGTSSAGMIKFGSNPKKGQHF
jgi:phage gp36-like protein